MGELDRRTSIRATAEYSVNYLLDDDYVLSFSRDISADGMFIRTDKPAKEGNIIHLNFDINNVSGKDIEATVVYCNANPKSNETGMGVKFNNIDSELKDAILHIVNRVAILIPE